MKNWAKLSLLVVLVVVLGLILNSTHASKQFEPIKDKTELGKLLFFDTRLSLDSSISCASCHLPEFAFADTTALSKGVGSKFGLRNAPSVMNVKFRDQFFYDGRAKDIEDQVHFPVEDPLEMNLSFDAAVKRIAENPQYLEAFKRFYGEAPNRKHVANAIAEFERSLESSNTPYDDFMNDKPSMFSASAQRGMDVFLSDKAKCFDCHFGPDFTGDEFRNIGLFNGKDWNDSGRYKVTGLSADIGKFKVPGLRNVAVTGPYMHNGAFKTLSDVIDYYNQPDKFVPNAINRDSALAKPLNLTAQEKEDLLNFLLSLTDKRFTQ
ncbi:MAG: cytochrome-c peroxidase [Bacteroidetes bacterium]|nr:cytochrome-c peroxidase [Bacteroidota bacterium]